MSDHATAAYLDLLGRRYSCRKFTDEQLTDEEMADFLHRKWIVPVCQGINGSLTAVLSALETTALALSRKYAVSYQQIDNDIAQANAELSQLVSQLTGDAFAIKGLESLIKQ